MAQPCQNPPAASARKAVATPGHSSYEIGAEAEQVGAQCATTETLSKWTCEFQVRTPIIPVA